MIQRNKRLRAAWIIAVNGLVCGAQGPGLSYACMPVIIFHTTVQKDCGSEMHNPLYILSGFKAN